MSAELRVDTREFAAAMREYMKHTSRTLAEAINTKAYYIARGATRQTEKANAAQIEAELGVIGYRTSQVTRGKNKGKFRKGKMIVRKRSLAEAILRSRLYKKGAAQPTKDEMGPKVEAFIKARIRSVAFIKAGWIEAIKKLAPFAKDKANAPKVDTSAKRWSEKILGSATAAQPGMNPTATIANSAVPDHGKTGVKALSKVATRGLQRAIKDEIRSIADYVSGKMQQTTNPHNAGRP